MKRNNGVKGYFVMHKKCENIGFNIKNFYKSCIFSIFSISQTEDTVFSTSSSMLIQTTLCFLRVKSSSIAFKLLAAVKSTESILEQSITTGVARPCVSKGDYYSDMGKSHIPWSWQPC